MDLTGFLTARLDEDEQAARQCDGQRWDFTGAASPEVRIREDDGDLGRVVAYCRDGGDATAEFSRAIHIACFDPARVLREVEAKRKILAWHICEFVRAPQPGVRYQCSGCSQEWWPCQTLEALAAVWSDHPDYDRAWKA